MKPNRSNLSVPGHRKKMHLKALGSSADVVMFDLEDSVPPEQKELARKTIIKTLGEIKDISKTISVRINSVDTPFAFKDIIEVTGAVGNVIDALVVPKVNHPGDIHFASRLLDGIEMAQNIKSKIQIEACIETAKGLEQVSKIALASSRIKSLVFGIADYSASIGVRLNSVSGHGEREEDIYPGHRWHYPLSRMVMAAKANDLFAIDAPYGDFKNINGLEHSAKMASAIGCDGKWVIHPDQIETVNKVFTPSNEDIQRAKKILDLFKTGGLAKTKAIAIDGKMIDQATFRLAKQLWDQAVFLKLI
jgi:malyl-CoA/(S)-citramalyl-CoA lyase